MISKKAEDILKPWEQARAKMYAYVRTADAEELAEIIAACREPNQTNCWFVTYEAAQDLLRMALQRQRELAEAKQPA